MEWVIFQVFIKDKYLHTEPLTPHHCVEGVVYNVLKPNRKWKYNVKPKGGCVERPCQRHHVSLLNLKLLITKDDDE